MTKEDVLFPVAICTFIILISCAFLFLVKPSKLVEDPVIKEKVEQKAKEFGEMAIKATTVSCTLTYGKNVYYCVAFSPPSAPLKFACTETECVLR